MRVGPARISRPCAVHPALASAIPSRRNTMNRSGAYADNSASTIVKIPVQNT